MHDLHICDVTHRGHVRRYQIHARVNHGQNLWHHTTCIFVMQIGTQTGCTLLFGITDSYAARGYGRRLRHCPYQGRGPLTKATRTPARTPPHRRRWVCYPRLVYWGYAINMTCVTWGSGCSRSPPCPYRGTGTPLPPAGGEAFCMAVQLWRWRRGGGGRCV